MRGCWGRVLIETLWNVNPDGRRRQTPESAGFNRNIVECKLQFIVTLCRCNSVLIETLWNVNEDEKARVCDDANVLIETLWNVNDHGRKQR